MDLSSPKPKRQLTPEARERMRLGQYKGLRRAVAKRKADCSANYATNFNHGQTTPDFVRSAEAAGETRKAVRSHLSLVDRTLLKLCGLFPRIARALSGAVSRSTFESPRTLGPDPKLPPRTDTASPRVPKLVRALALLLWRPLRLFRTQEHWEWLALCYCLRQLIGWRQKHGELTVERVEEFHEHLSAITGNYNWEVSPRLNRIEKRFWKVWPLYRGLVGVFGTVLGSRDSMFGFRCSGEKPRDSGAQSGEKLPIGNQESQIKSSESPTADHQSQIANCEHQGHSANLRFPNTENRTPSPGPRIPDPESRASGPEPRPLLQFRGTPHYDRFHPTWLERIDDLTSEAIANPFQSPSHTLKAQQRRTQTAAVKDPKLWQESAAAPRLPETELHERETSYFARYPSERDLRHMLRSGELIVPGAFEDFVDLVEAALGPVAQPLVAMRKKMHGHRSTAKSNRATPEPYLRALAESLWNRTHVFSSRAAELHKLLEATLLWDPNRFLRLWLKLLPVEYGHDMVSLFRRAHRLGHEEIAWGDPEPGEPHQRRAEPRPAVVPLTEAEGRRKHAGELQAALRIWFVALWQALEPVIRSSQKTTVALYEWAVSRFGIREEFVVWRPALSLNQLKTRRDRPEWAVRLVTGEGKALVKLRDGQMFEPGGRVSGARLGSSC